MSFLEDNSIEVGTIAWRAWLDSEGFSGGSIVDDTRALLEDQGHWDGSMSGSLYALYESSGGAPSSGLISLSVPSGNIPSDLTDFLMLVNLEDMPSEFWDGVASDGSDLAMLNEAEELLPYFLVDWDFAGNSGYVYVLTDLSSTVSTQLNVEYGGGDSDRQDTALTLANYAAFFLASKNGDLQELVTDVSWTDGDTTSVVSKNLGLHPTTGYPLVSSERIEGSTTSRIRLDNTIGKYTDYTMANTFDTVNAGQTQGLLSYTEEIGAQPQIRRNLYLWAGDVGYWQNVDGFLLGAAAVVDTPTRQHITIEGGVKSVQYIDGTFDVEDTSIATDFLILDSVGFGYDAGNLGAPFTGNFGQAYVRIGALSSDFISAEYDNMEDPSTFYTVS